MFFRRFKNYLKDRYVDLIHIPEKPSPSKNSRNIAITPLPGFMASFENGGSISTVREIGSERVIVSFSLFEGESFYIGNFYLDTPSGEYFTNNLDISEEMIAVMEDIRFFGASNAVSFISRL